jgi:hypothetical protein
VAPSRRQAWEGEHLAFGLVQQPKRATAEGREIERARRALRLQRLKVSDREDPFAEPDSEPLGE